MASVIPSAPLGTDAAEDRSGLRAAMGQRPHAAAERRFRFELAAHPGSVAQARRLARSRLAGWAVCEDTCDTAILVVSELVTNAIVHAAGQSVICELRDADDVVRIAVCDEGCAPGEPHPSPQRPDEEHGRGLLLVAAVSRAWGAQDTGPGLLVWAEIPHSADRAENTGREPGSPEAGIGPRADLGWSAKKPPNDGRGTGAEGSWGAGTVGNPRPPSVRNGNGDGDRRRDVDPCGDGDPRRNGDPRQAGDPGREHNRDQEQDRDRDRDRESL
ncbi:ATP-binding protein [Streptomyces sp. NPDC127066]|uniref:ATP-binding protein n=1 Tax=Streptomyces sp. NPDC127066 TaxID=3347125 RepID=UPI00365AC2EE